MATTIVVGTNIKRGNQRTLMALVKKALSQKRNNHFHSVPYPRIFRKAGVPASSTAADSPGAKGVIIFDATNSIPYICTAFTSSSVFTLVAMA